MILVDFCCKESRHCLDCDSMSSFIDREADRASLFGFPRIRCENYSKKASNFKRDHLEALLLCDQASDHVNVGVQLDRPAASMVNDSID
jgi:hypothetical protein